MKNLVVVAGNGLLDRRAFLRGGAALAANAQTLPKVRTPNRDGFIPRFPDKL